MEEGGYDGHEHHHNHGHQKYHHGRHSHNRYWPSGGGDYEEDKYFTRAEDRDARHAGERIVEHDRYVAKEHRGGRSLREVNDFDYVAANRKHREVAAMAARDWERITYRGNDDEEVVRVVERSSLNEQDRHISEKQRERDMAYTHTERHEPKPVPMSVVICQQAPTVLLRQAPREAHGRKKKQKKKRAGPSDDSGDGDDSRCQRHEEHLAMERYDGRLCYGREPHNDSGQESKVMIKKPVCSKKQGPTKGSSSQIKRHLTEGALVGAGLAALIASRRKKDGDFQGHGGRKVLAGAALGAAGSEVVRRVTSAIHSYDRQCKEKSHSRATSPASSNGGWSESRSGSSRIRTGLGIAAVALAAAGAAKYHRSNKAERAEAARGRPLYRRSSSEWSRSSSPPKQREPRRASSIAKAALGTAAIAGFVKHMRDTSLGQDRARSRSRLRTAAELLGAGLVGAAGKKLYDRQQDKKERKRYERERQFSDEESEHAWRSFRSSQRNSLAGDSDMSPSPSRSPSQGRVGPYHPSSPPGSSTTEAELGMIEYGAHPLYLDLPAGQGHRRQCACGSSGYESDEDDEVAGGRQTRRSRRRRGHGDARDSHYRSDSERSDWGTGKKSGRSRLRHKAVGAAAAAGAAIGLKKAGDRKGKGTERQSSRDRDRGHGQDRDRERAGGRERDRERRRYEDETPTDCDDHHCGGGYGPPPLASGGAYDPPSKAGLPYLPPGPATAFTQHHNMATPNRGAQQQYQAYNPDIAVRFPMSPPGPPPDSAPFPPPSHRFANPPRPGGVDGGTGPEHTV